jgi:hypothetical protein
MRWHHGDAVFATRFSEIDRSAPVQHSPRDQPVHSSSSFVYVGRRSAITGFTGKAPLRFTASATFMRLSRRNFLYAALGAAFVPGRARVVSASDYPTRPVRLNPPT